MVKAIRTVRNEEMDYVAASKKYNALPVTSFIPELQNNAPRSTSRDCAQQKWGHAQTGQAKEGSKAIIFPNTISIPLSVVEEAADKDCFKTFMMQHRNKMSVGQPTRVVTVRARAGGFSMEKCAGAEND